MFGADRVGELQLLKANSDYETARRMVREMTSKSQDGFDLRMTLLKRPTLDRPSASTKLDFG